MIRGLVVTSILVVVAVSLAGPATAQTVDNPVDLGSVVITGEAANRVLTEGGSTTSFGLQLPTGASCPGDSANDQWRVQTFIVPARVDPGTLTYNVVGPEGEGVYALYGLDTNPLTSRLTAQNARPGTPGLITGLPSASFEVFPPGTLPVGEYRIGVACTFFAETASYWDTAIEIISTPEDLPANLRWRLTDAAKVAGDASTSTGGTNPTPVLLVAALGTVAGVFVVRRFRKPIIEKEKI